MKKLFYAEYSCGTMGLEEFYFFLADSMSDVLITMEDMKEDYIERIKTYFIPEEEEYEEDEAELVALETAEDATIITIRFATPEDVKEYPVESAEADEI